MALSYQQVTVFNFDDSYTQQASLLEIPHTWIECKDIPQTNMYCQRTSLKRIEQKCSALGPRGIAFIGSGNYHYVSYLLLQRFQESYTLLLFDHHPDTMDDVPLLSCGSWVNRAVRDLPNLCSVVILGVSRNWKKQIPVHLFSKIKAVTTEKVLQFSVEKVISLIPTQHVYISIDKDVLTKEDAITNWDQGNMPLQYLLSLLTRILRAKEVLGVDVCGEYPPVTPFGNPLSRTASKKNEQANRAIYETIIRSA